MALRALETHQNHIRDLNLGARRKFLAGIDIFRPRHLHLVSHQRESKALATVTGRAIIIAGSGMATGGRILHHLQHHLPNPRATVLFVGYQAEGTRGRSLREGAPRVRMFGQEVEVRAQIRAVEGFSGHADYLEMLAWLMPFNKPVERVFLVHGEPAASEALRDRVRKEFNWPVTLPREGESFELDL